MTDCYGREKVVTDLRHQVSELECKASEFQLLAGLATNPELELYNKGLSAELYALAQRLRGRLKVTEEDSRRNGAPEAERSRTKSAERPVPVTHAFDENGRRVLLGLTLEETTEFEILDARLPFDGKPIWATGSTTLSPIEKRWLELYTQHERARETGTYSLRSRLRTKRNAELPPIPIKAARASSEIVAVALRDDKE